MASKPGNLFNIALASLRYFGTTNLAIAMGVAAATAVLTGALIVGESMRSSLKGLTLQRLGKIDEMIVSEGFFRAAIAQELSRNDVFEKSYRQATPAILFPGGTVETVQQPGSSSRPETRRASQVTVLGIQSSFDEFESDAQLEANYASFDSEYSAVINQALADELGMNSDLVESGKALVTVRIPKREQLPADSALGRKTDLIESLVDLKVTRIVPNEGLGRFSLFPSQADPLNVYVPIGLLQDSLSRTVLKHKKDRNQANAIFLERNLDRLPRASDSSGLRKSMRLQLADYGLMTKSVELSYLQDKQPKQLTQYFSISSDRLVISDEASKAIESAFPDAKPVFTYLANDIRLFDKASGVPFSMMSGIDFDAGFQMTDVQGRPIPALKDDQVVLNQWTANDLKANVGDKISVTYFNPETTHGAQIESTAEFVVAAIAPLTEPDGVFEFHSRRGLTYPTFSKPLTLANDPDLTPEVPGVTDAETIEDWDLPFSTVGKLRAQDETYWESYRTTPKAFVNLRTARKLWGSRFGRTTSYRIPVGDKTIDSIESKVLDRIVQDDAKLGIELVEIKQRGLAASSGSTPFDVLFLALSMFVIGSALILVSLLFRLGLQQRASQIGLMKATGFDSSKLRRLWLTEMSLVALVGAAVGVGLGVAYAWLMIQGLTTWWVGAISRPFLTMNLSWLSLSIGFLSGLLVCIVTIAISLRRANRQPVIRLLRGQLESDDRTTAKSSTWNRWIAWALILLALVLAFAAAKMSGEAQAGAFMGAGFLMLTSFLILVFRWLRQPGSKESAGSLSPSSLALVSAKRNPMRSTLTIGLVAVASFLIAAVSAFRLKPTEQGTAGFEWVAQSSQPIFDDLGDIGSDQSDPQPFGDEYRLPKGTEVLSLRYKAGEDASCNNLYQSTQPRALGVPARFVEHFRKESVSQFAWAGSLATSEMEKANPWELLNGETPHSGAEDDPIPVVLDKNTANYSLKIYLLGTVKKIEYDTGETIFVKVVGFLANTVLQGSLIMSEKDFESSFPTVAGYQFFLIDEPEVAKLEKQESARLGARPFANEQESMLAESPVVSILEDRLGDQGFDARSADKVLSNFMAVQNTYLTTFQTLGGLGLLLGTFGLAAVQVRSVFEREKEFGLMRAVGFSLPQLSRMVLLENAWLLAIGMGVGIGAALFTTIPHWLSGAASIPWLSLGLIFALILVIGLAAGLIASSRIGKVPMLAALRG